MKQKFTYMLMDELYDTKRDKAVFETDDYISYIVTVNNINEACKKARELKNEGVGIIELSGAFGKAEADKIIRATDNKVGIGYIVNSESQKDIFERFFRYIDN